MQQGLENVNAVTFSSLNAANETALLAKTHLSQKYEGATVNVTVGQESSDPAQIIDVFVLIAWIRHANGTKEIFVFDEHLYNCKCDDCNPTNN